MYIYKTKLGNGQIEVQANDFKTLIEESSILLRIPKECHVCKSTDIGLNHKNPKGNDYYGISCQCGAELNFHQKKEGGFYIKYDDKMEKWTGNG